MTKQEAKDSFISLEMQGWLRLIDLLYDAIPENIEITEIFEKYANFEVRYKGEENKKFERFVQILKRISSKMCEKCGKLASHTIINNWEQTLCKEHFEEAILGKQMGEYYPEIYPDL